MSRFLLVAIALGLASITGSVLAQDVSAPAEPQELASTELPSELDRVLRDYERAWRTGDAAALAALFAEDGFVLQGNRPPVRGRTAIRAAYEGQGGADLRLRALAFSTGERSGYIIGGYRYGDAPSDMGKFTLTLSRSPGKPWLIFSDMDNANAPPKPRRASSTP